MMINPNPNMLLRIAQADAYGFGCEYIKSPQHDDIKKKCLEFTQYVHHPVLSHPAGHYTDDAEMSIANAKVLMAGEENFVPTTQHFADEYVREFQLGGRRKGYSKGFQTLLEEVRTGRELLEKLNPTSNKNGAAMRSVPFGVIPEVYDMILTTTRQAVITHNTPEGIFSSNVVALMSHFTLYTDYSLDQVKDYCSFHSHNFLDDRNVEPFSHVFKKNWSGRVVDTPDASVAITTTHAVLQLVSQCKSLKEIMMQVIDWGGDTDSVAAIAWGIASARYQDEELPEFLERDLEEGSVVTGSGYLKHLGSSFMGKYQRMQNV